MLQWFLRAVVALFFVLGLQPLFAQATPTPAAAPTETTGYRPAVIYAGPGDTFRQLGVLRPGNPITIIERNRIGNWLHIQQKDRNGFVQKDGWVLTGYLNIPPELRFSQVTVNTQLPDADPATVDSQALAQLYAVPVIPTISPKMRAVYQRGQALGLNSHVMTKVGDSLTFNPMYLEPMSQEEANLGPYDYLADALQYFGPAVSSSVATKMGLATYTIFDPMWADEALCQPNETPLDCEYRRKMPSVAFILFGPNDVLHTGREKYTARMNAIVEETLQRGIIPVLSTFSADPEGEYWWQAVELNLALVEVAETYDVPLINLWAAARVLPEYGLDKDHVHMKNSGFVYLMYASGHEAWYGTSLRNLLSLRTLDEILHTVILETEK